MAAARRRGLHVGRPLKLDPNQLVYAWRMIQRPADVIGNAVHVMRVLTGEIEEPPPR
jgi:hypothetical protein